MGQHARGFGRAVVGGLVLREDIRKLGDLGFPATRRECFAREADTFAATDQQDRGRKCDSARAGGFAGQIVGGSERHRGRLVYPNHHRLRDLPFLVSDKVCVGTRRPAPVDAA